ncbi:MAG: hypothetical protein ACE5F3_08695 [Mariprofundaceae bacterium]
MPLHKEEKVVKNSIWGSEGNRGRNRVMFRGHSFPVLLVAALILSACAQPFRHLAESDHASLGRIGVLSSNERPEVKLVLPAKGPLRGALRGAGSGAKAAIYGGLFTPIPGGVILGVLVSPVFAAVGAVYGAIKALPEMLVARNEISLRASASQLELNTAVHRHVVTYLASQSGYAVSDLGVAQFDASNPSSAIKNDAGKDIDTVLLIKVTHFSTQEEGINAPFSMAIDADTRLIRIADALVLAEGRVRFTSQEKPLDAWTEANDRLFKETARRGTRQLAEQIVYKHVLYYGQLDNGNDDGLSFLSPPEPVSPREDDLIFDSAEVDSLRPEFCWQPFAGLSGTDASTTGSRASNGGAYRLRILDNGEEISVADKLRGKCHRIHTDLEPDHDYTWTIEAWFEAEGRVRVSRSEEIAFHTPIQPQGK